MKFLLSLNRINELISRSKLDTKRLLSIFYGCSPVGLDGKEYSEITALEYSLSGKKEISNKILSITRDLCKKNRDIILLISLLRNDGEQMGNYLDNNVNNFVLKRKEPISTFEDFYSLRFNDIKDDKVFLSGMNVFLFIQSLLSGKPSKYSRLEGSVVLCTAPLRFENHTYASTQTLISTFCKIGSIRVAIEQKLSFNQISYIIRKKISTFDLYVSTLRLNSPISILTKTRPFYGVFELFSNVIDQKSILEIYSILSSSSQTFIRKEISMILWKAAFEDCARSVYTYCFLVNGEENLIIPSIFNSISHDITKAGHYIKILKTLDPDHPVFEISEEYHNCFIELLNIINQYESNMRNAIFKTARKWMSYNENKMKNEKNEYFKFKYALKKAIKEKQLMELRRQKIVNNEKRKRYKKLQKELIEYKKQKEHQEEIEKFEKDSYIKGMVSNRGNNPLVRPFTIEELVLIEKEKIDIFNEFRNEMERLGADEERIMEFFPEINVPKIETDVVPEIKMHSTPDPMDVEDSDIHIKDISIGEEDIFQISNSFNEDNDISDPIRHHIPPSEDLNSIPSLLYRLVIPSFKIQKSLLSEAIFSLLVHRDRFLEQFILIGKLFLIHPSTEMDDFLKSFFEIPHTTMTSHKICYSFKNAAIKMGFSGNASVMLFPKPPQSIDELLLLTNSLRIVITPMESFSILLGESLSTVYPQLFRYILFVKLCRSAINYLWLSYKDTYTDSKNRGCFSYMTKFVVSIETYIYQTVLTPVSKILFLKARDLSTIESFQQFHQDILVKLMKSSLLSDEMAPIRNLLVSAMNEIIVYAYGPIYNLKQAPFSEFRHKASLFSDMVHQLNISLFEENPTIRFLDSLFNEFVQ